MKKRLIILFSILGVVVLLVVLGSVTFTLQEAEVRFYNEDGTLAAVPVELTSDLMLGEFKGDGIFSLDENALADSINNAFGKYYCIQVERAFPNKAIVHLAERKSVFYLRKGDNAYLLDVTGWVVDKVDYNTGLIDISNMANYVDQVEENSTITWLTSQWSDNFSYLQTAISTIWRFYYNYEEMNRIVSNFSFDSDSLTITTATHSKIVIKGADVDLVEKLEKSIGVYYNNILDVTIPQMTITVDEQGNVKTS